MPPDREQQEIRLTPVSYIVLGLLAELGKATPYDLKQAAATGVRNLWSIQHAQLYSEPERLEKAGYVKGRQEQTGRRRKHYTITKRGRKALEEWLAVPTHGFTELRDPGLLQLLFGADPAALAKAQLEVHRAKLEEFQALRASGATSPPGFQRVFDAGIGHQREWIRYWSRIAREEAEAPTRRRR